ncbi:protein of unknown function [Malonomonas rubra DSM 5091]|uniref:AsmA family protein n=1 Tax=Malonomonas rubra DSM 5091 TaxID=1122189 RepID=A0A1M6G8S1_MALRU|nr:DUF748 domain-containing protein [Malonomonas rubra]SHJ06336.1 protein of unknown function [Malonomonas rubra DSM 5091]
MPRWKKYLLIVAASILGLLLLSMLIVPWQIKVQGSKWFAENTTRILTIEKAFFNPFALTVEVKGVTLTEQQSEKTFVSLDRLMVSASSRSLLDFALILDRIELDAPYANIELLGKQEFNFSDFTRLGGDQPPADPEPQKDAGEFHFSFNNIIINGGSLDFTDHTSPKKSQHQVRELALAVPFVGNVSYLTDEYVEPQLRLLLNGSLIDATGQLKPFHESLETSLSLSLNDIDLAFYAFHSPVPLPVEVESGSLDTQIDLTYRVSSTAQPKVLLSGEMALSDIDIRQNDGSELFRMPTLILDLDWADLMQQDFNLLSLDIYEPELFVSRTSDGLWNFQQLMPSATEAVEEQPVVEEETTQKSALPLVKVEQVALFDGKVYFNDQLPPGGIVEELHGINLLLTDLSTIYDQKTGIDFRLATAREVTTSVKGDVGINPPTATLDMVVNGVPFAPYNPYLVDFLTAPVQGSLNLAGSINYDVNGNVRLQHGQLALHQLEVPFIDDDGFRLQDLLLTGVTFDLQQEQVGAASVQLSGGDLRASRLADGSLSPHKLLTLQAEEEPVVEEVEEEVVEIAEDALVGEQTEDGFAVTVGKFDLSDFNLKFTDASLSKKPQLEVKQLTVSLADLVYPESADSPFSISARLGEKGKIDLNGKVAHSPLRLQAQTQVNALALADFNGFIPDNVNVSLRDGKLFTNLAVKLTEQPEAMTGSFAGKISLDNFNLRDPLGEGELLAWESLNVAGIKGEISPFKLLIEEVALSKYLAKILIDQNGQINLANVTAAEEQGTEETEPPETATAAESEAEEVVASVDEDSAPPADIRVDALTLQGGTVSFTDRSLPNTFSATMYKLGGRVTGMASDENMQADVDLRGELENHSPLTISGKLNPLSKDLFADLTIKFKDIDLAPMTPYSGTYLGKVIDKGKLYLDLSYHIEHQKIKADNKIMIDQFTFGDSVESDKATSLPVGLAIALLKDSNDEIHLDVPISGDLNDPSFSIMGTVFTVLKNLVVKAATAPFSLLAGMLGGGDEDFTNLTFASGIARLDERQLVTLDKLAGMLEKRPSLILELSAFADQQKDPEAFRKDQLNQQMLAVKRQELADAPEPLAISAEEYPDYLLKVYKAAEFPRPRNFVGLLKSLPDEEMEKLLLANIRADDEVLKGLAQERAQVVRDALVNKHEELKPRIFLKTVDPFLAPEKGSASRVEFSIKTK